MITQEHTGCFFYFAVLFLQQTQCSIHPLSLDSEYTWLTLTRTYSRCDNVKLTHVQPQLSRTYSSLSQIQASPIGPDSQHVPINPPRQPKYITHPYLSVCRHRPHFTDIPSIGPDLTYFEQTAREGAERGRGMERESCSGSRWAVYVFT